MATVYVAGMLWLFLKVGFRSVYFESSIVAAAMLNEGVFAIFTGIYPLPIKVNYYVYGRSDLKRIGLAQSLFALVVIIASVFLTFLIS